MAYTTYTNTGPFTAGGAPGISAVFLNAVETFLASGWFDSQITSDHAGGLQPVSLKPSSSVTVSGTTSGNAVLYQFLQGTVKGFVLFLNGYRNSGNTEQTISLPVAFTSRCLFFSGNCQSIRPYQSGSALTGFVNIITALSSSGGTFSAQDVIKSACIGEIFHSFDALGLGVLQGSAFTAAVFGIGI